MKSKKLTYLFYGYIALVVIIALLLLYSQQQKKTQKQSNPNIITSIDSDKTNHETQEITQKVINIESMRSNSNTEISVTETTDALSYMDVYEDLQSTRACRPFYRFWREQGLSADVSNRVGRPHYFFGEQVYAGDEKVPLTATQNETLEHWVKKCYQVWLDYGEFESGNELTIPLNDVTDVISKKLLSITAKTPKEQKLKQVRQLAAQWTASFKVLEGAYEGEDSLEPSVAQSLHNELAMLRHLDEEVKSQWFAAQSNNQPDEAAFRDQHFDLLNQIRALEHRIKQQKVVNPDSLTQAIDSFQSIDGAINDAIKTQHAEVFFEYIYAFSGKQPPFLMYLGFEYTSPTRINQLANLHRISTDQLVYAAAGLEVAIAHQFELRYATHLYLCDLGWDCGPQSPIVMNYCLFGLGSYPDACDQNLSDFYQQHFISPNRWADVIRFKSLYKDMFYE